MEVRTTLRINRSNPLIRPGSGEGGETMQATTEQALRIAKALESIAKSLTHLVEEIITLRQDYVIHLEELKKNKRGDR